MARTGQRQGIGIRRFVRAACFAVLLPAIATTAFSAETYTGGVAAADHPLASQAGAEMLAMGGNAVDAAVATSFASSVVRPMSCGIGGGGFMVVHLTDDPRTKMAGDAISVAIDYRETAPAAMTEDYFEQFEDLDASQLGGASVAIPTTVEGLHAAHERFGVLEWEDVLAPAIRFAAEGYVPDDYEQEQAGLLAEWFEESPERKQSHRAAYECFVLQNAKEGELRMNPEQARALRLVAEHGAEAFRTGPIADAIVETVRAAGGVMTIEDLSSERVRWGEPLRGAFHGRTVLTMPTSSSGGIVLTQTLGVIEQYERMHRVELASMGHNTAESAHLIAEALKHAFSDRARWLGDMPMDDPRIVRLLAPEHFKTIAARIQEDGIQRNRTYGWKPDEAVVDGQLPDDAGTSHISVVDADGNAVAMTETINLGYGSKVLVSRFGFLLNNEMDDFSARRGVSNAFDLYQSDANRPEPGKKPISSMTPTIVLGEDGAVEAVVGASGGPRIITGTLQALLNAIVWGMDAERAVREPRFHHQWRPNAVLFEDDLNAQRIRPGERSPAGMQSLMSKVNALQALRLGLKKKGHNLGSIEKVGDVQLVLRAPDGDGYQAASDPRKGGKPAGIEPIGSRE